MAKEIRCKPCRGRSPYQDWIQTYGFVLEGELREKFLQNGIGRHLIDEIAKGDPDSIATVESQYIDSLLQAILDVLDEGGEQVLTPKQRRAFQLIVREGVSYRQTARMMRINVNAVQDLVKAGAKKLRILALTK